MRQHAVVVVLLVCLSATVQAWMGLRAVVPAQDAVRAVAAAQVVERHGVPSALQGGVPRPLYPLLVWLAWNTVFHRDPLQWASAVQFTASAAVVLSVIPFYGLLYAWRDARLAGVGTAVFATLAGTARLGPDGLADAPHLALVLCALWGIVATLGQPVASPGWVLSRLLPSGLALGAATLMRAEALIVVPAFAVATLVLPGKRHFARMVTTGLHLGFLGVGCTAVWLPMLAMTGGKAATARLTGAEAEFDPGPLNCVLADLAFQPVEPAGGWNLPNGEPMRFEVKDAGSTSRFTGVSRGAVELSKELASFFPGLVLALAAFGCFSAVRTGRLPVELFLALLSAFALAAALAWSTKVGYLSWRHLAILTAPVVGWAVRAILAAGDRASSTLHALCLFRRPWLNPAVAAATVVVSMAASLPSTLPPLHQSRGGHRSAADWLVSQGRRAGAVLDSRGWTGLYTGRRTYRLESARLAFGDPQLAYVILEEVELAPDTPRARTLKDLLRRAGRLEQTFSAKNKNRVLVYSWSSNRLAEAPGSIAGLAVH